MKQCTKCKQMKPLSAYAKRPENIDNRCEQCKECAKKVIDKRLEEIKYRKQFEIV